MGIATLLLVKEVIGLKRDYEIISELSEIEVEDLVEFLGSRAETTLLQKVVQEKRKPVGTVFRGINFRKKNLVIGHTYQHWNSLSSWSKSKDVAVGFALEEYVPEGLLEEVATELGYDPRRLEDTCIYDAVSQEIVQVVFCVPDGYGFDVNQFIHHETFSKEQEVIHYDGQWRIKNVLESHKDGKTYYEVELEVVEQRAVA